jgi:hypothetical protein
VQGVLDHSWKPDGAARGISVYRFHDIALTVTPPELEARVGLHRLCASLAWQRTCGEPQSALRRMTLRLHGHAAAVPPAAFPDITPTDFTSSRTTCARMSATARRPCMFVATVHHNLCWNQSKSAATID